MELRVKVDTEKLTAALLKYPEIVRPLLRKRMGIEMERVATFAQVNHRFTPRSGNLARAIVSSVSSAGLQGSVHLDGGLAPYAEFIHEGTGRYGPKKQDFFVAPVRKKALHWGRHFSKGHYVKGWRPDRFLYRAFSKLKMLMRQKFTDTYKEALQRAGL
jgi:hypothetical protein